MYIISYHSSPFPIRRHTLHSDYHLVCGARNVETHEMSWYTQLEISIFELVQRLVVLDLDLLIFMILLLQST